MSDQAAPRQIRLKDNFFVRPYTSPITTSGDTPQQDSGLWSASSFVCPGLSNFLSNPKHNGLFLIAGPRGTGKTALARHAASQATSSHSIAYADAEDIGLHHLLKIEEKSVSSVALDAAMLRGIVFMLSRYFHKGDKNKEIKTVLNTLEKQCMVDQYALTNIEGYTRKAAAEAKGGINLNYLKILSSSLRAKISKHFSKSAQEKAVFNNNPDFLRLNLRSVFHDFGNDDWPILIIDELDRFITNRDDTVKILESINRMKGLLTDYPSAIVFISSEEIYQAIHHGFEPTSYMDTPQLLSLFHHYCFLAPNLEKKTRINNPLKPFIQAWLESMDSTIDLDEIADYILFETGANPLQAKKFLSQHISTQGDNTSNLYLHWDASSHIKAALSRAVQTLSAKWITDYDLHTHSAYDWHRRFRYLHSRARLYYELAKEFDGPNQYPIPFIKTQRIPFCPDRLLNYLDSKKISTAQLLSKNANSAENSQDLNEYIQHMESIDRYLLTLFFKVFSNLGAYKGNLKMNIREDRYKWVERGALDGYKNTKNIQIYSINAQDIKVSWPPLRNLSTSDANS